uniref:Aminotransferase-like plant mobile domain-containing protein n=1 Tax=Oryza punctata TaxID=4537 RepID=A0A0E0LA15_ORYPU
MSGIHLFDLVLWHMAQCGNRNLGKATSAIDSEDCDGLNGASDNSSDSESGEDLVVDLKKKYLGSSSYHFQKPKDKKWKVAAKNDSSFSRFSSKYFSKVISSLTPHQRDIIELAVFSNLLKFASNFVPKKFATWIANHVDCKTSEIILRDKVIPIRKDSVKDILGLPCGGFEFGKDYDAGKQFILSKYGLSSLPSIRFFGDQFIKRQAMSDDKVITSFLIVALACFLCPNSSTLPSTKYLTIFEYVNILSSYDWAKFVYDWSMSYMKKFIKTNSLGGCFFFWAVLYLDYVEFGERNVPNTIPRISVWVNNMINTYADFDKIDDDTYGLRPLKDLKSTCYYQHQHCSDTRIPFEERLQSAIGPMLPSYVKDSICSMVVDHSSSIHSSENSSCEELLIAILAMIAESARNESYEVQDFVVDDDAVVDDIGNSKSVDRVISSAYISAHLLLVTPEVGYAKRSSPIVGKIFDGFGTAASTAAIQNVITNFRSTLSQVNNHGNRENICSLSRPSFNLLDSKVDASNPVNASGDIISSSAQDLISLQSLNATPNDGLAATNNQLCGASGSNNSQNFNKRLFQDLTNSPDVVCLGEKKFSECSKRICVKAEEIYNATN